MLEACAHAGPGRRDHPAAGAPARHRRGDPVQRHRRAAQGHRGRPRHQARRRPGHRPADPHRGRPRRSCGRWRTATSTTWPRRCALLVAELGATPLIGFAGAPFTLASYLVEGGPSRNHEHTKALMYGDPGLWDALMQRLAGITATFLRVQVEAGRQRDPAVRLLGRRAAGRATTCGYVQPHSAAVLAAVGELGVPRIHFGVGTGELLGLMGEAGAEVVGVDFRVPLDEATAPGRPGPRAAGQPRPRGRCSRRGTWWPSGPARSWRPGGPRPVTCSTSATA